MVVSLKFLQYVKGGILVKHSVPEFLSRTTLIILVGLVSWRAAFERNEDKRLRKLRPQRRLATPVKA